MFENRRYLIIPSSVVDQVDFNQVYQTSVDTLRYSLDGSKTFVKYDVSVLEEDYTHTVVDPDTGEETTQTIAAGVYGRPLSVYNDAYPEYTHSEILNVLAGPEWTEPMVENGDNL